MRLRLPKFFPRETLLMAAGHRLARMRQHPLAVEHGDRAGGKTGVEAQHEHARPLDGCAHVGKRQPSVCSTRVTSGT